MRKQLFIILLVISSTALAQHEFIGMAGGGGKYDRGTIYTTDSIGRYKATVYDFNYVDATGPAGEFTKMPDSTFMGVAFGGYKHGKGVIYSYDPRKKSYQVRYHFGDSSDDGHYPSSKLLLASNGLMYGTTTKGGTYNKGTFFTFDPATNKHTKIFDLGEDSESGYEPTDGFMESSSGDLFVLVIRGGPKNAGLIYKCDTSNHSVTKVHSFEKETTGSTPMGILEEAPDGNLYGVTLSGGYDNIGVIFRLDPNSNEVKKLFDFNYRNTTGSNPHAGLTLASNGKFYGTTERTDVIFEFDYVTNKYTRKARFVGGKGDNPRSKLIEHPNGRLYGTAISGGNSSWDGSIFSYLPGEDTITKEHQFVAAREGSKPYQGLILADDGTFYGTTSEGDNSLRDGVIFHYNPTNHEFTKELNFNGDLDGNQPTGKLLQTKAGKLLGITQLGGLHNYGSLFEFDPEQKTITPRAHFTFEMGYGRRSIMEAANGKIYGSCANGGSENAGTLFVFDPQTDSLKLLMDFEETPLGKWPSGPLLEIDSGRLFGVASGGGTNGHGVLFEYKYTKDVLTNWHNFEDNVTGRAPQGFLVQSSYDKRIYGVTASGGQRDDGTLFQFNPTNNKFNTLIHMQRSVSGEKPVGGLLEASDGNLYGVTLEGGDFASGTLFNYIPSQGLLVRKASFSRGKKEVEAIGYLMESTLGRLYGVSYRGGDDFDRGVFFQYKLNTNEISYTFEFDHTNTGGWPSGGLIEYGGCGFTKTHLTDPEVTARAVNVSYQWLDCTNDFAPVENETSKTFRPKKDGSYAVEISTQWCKDTSSCVMLTPSSVEEFPLQGVKIFPNPSTGKVTVTCDRSLKNVQLRLYDVEGRLIKSKHILSESMELVLPELPGLYLLQIHSSEGQYIKKIIRQ